MSLPGKKMQIGGYNYHLSDQGKGDKVAFLVYGKTDRSVEVEHYRMMKISLIIGVSILLLVTLSSAKASSVTSNFGLNSLNEYQFLGAQNADVLGKLYYVGLFNDCLEL